MVATSAATLIYDSHITRAMNNVRSTIIATTTTYTNVVVYHHRQNEQQIANL